MASIKLRVVYDCNIFWRAFFSKRGVGGECKKLIDNEIVEHFISDDIVTEITNVLTRPATLARFPELTDKDVHQFLKDIVSKSKLIKSVPATFEIYRDIKDEPYINLAAAVDADVIVTTDKDLLDLMTGIDIESKQFRQRFRNLSIVTPIEFLKFMRANELSLKP